MQSTPGVEISNQSPLRRSWGIALSLVVAVLWAFVRVGPQASVGLEDDVQRALAWPNPELDGLNSYTRTSPIGPILFKLLGLAEPGLYLLIHVLAGIFGILLLTLWAYHMVEISANRWRASRLVILAPVTGMIFLSLGNYDPFTLLGFVIALWAWSRGSITWMVIAGTYLGVQHFEQSAVAVVAWSIGVLAFRDYLPRSMAWRNPLWTILGVILGKILLSAYFLLNGINAAEGRAAYFTDLTWPRSAVIGSINHFPILLLSLFAGLWAVVLVAFFLLKSVRERIMLIGAFALPALAAVTTLAQSRVFVMSTVPITMVMVVVVMSNMDVARNSVLLGVIEGIAWVVVPLHLYVSTTTGQALITTTNALDFNIMLLGRLGSLFG